MNTHSLPPAQDDSTRSSRNESGPLLPFPVLLGGALLLGAVVVPLALFRTARLAEAAGAGAASSSSPRSFIPPGVEPRDFMRLDPFPAGTAAPDFALPEVRDGRRLRLADFRGRPVVLLFGSFGCNLLCDRLGDLVRLHADYRDRAAFLFVYIVEALHPNPDLPPVPAGMEVANPLQAHREHIRRGLELYGVTMPCLDDADQTVVKAYGAFPRRLVVVDRSGRIAHDAGLGIFGDWDMQKFKEALAEVVRQDGDGLESGVAGQSFVGEEHGRRSGG